MKFAMKLSLPITESQVRASPEACERVERVNSLDFAMVKMYHMDANR